MITVDTFNDINEVDVFLKSDNITRVIGQGYNRLNTNGIIRNAMKRFNLTDKDYITHNYYEDENHLITSVTEPIGDYLKGSLY